MAEMMNIRATRERPTGFSDPQFYADEVTIIGFIHSNEPLAVYREHERIFVAPIWQFRIKDAALSEGGE